MTGTIPIRVAERAGTRYDVVGSCWVSTYSTASHGYAQIGWHHLGVRDVTTAHRAAFFYFFDVQPGALTVDHTCKNRRCVRPEHLRLLSNLDNARRTDGRDWPLGQCIKGHPDSNWRPKNENRIKGYCGMCRKA